MTENIIFHQQVRDASNTTLDVTLAAISAAANLGANAANTATVSANNGSVVLAKRINFVNTPNLKVVVTDSGTGNANVAIDIGVAVAANPAGSNTQIQYNNNGSFGGTANLSYNAATNNTSVNGIFNLNGTNVQSWLNSIYAKANTPSIYANGTLVVANQGNLNFNNTATINVFLTANGTQTNVAFQVNTSSVQSGSGTITDYSALATANQTVFTTSADASSASYVIVTRNGILQVPGTHYTLSGLRDITFTSNTELNDVIDCRIFSTSIAQSVVGTPGGANTWVQYNDGGTLGAVTNFSFNKGNNTVAITSGSLTINSLDVKNTLTTAFDTANSAANTVSVSANSGGVLSAKKLNFINSSSTLVHVNDVGSGIANISFDSQVLLITSLSDANTPMTVTGPGKGYIRSPKAFTLTAVRLSLANMSGVGTVPAGTLSIGLRNLGQAGSLTGNVQTMTGGLLLVNSANANIRGGCMTSFGWAGAANGNAPIVDTANSLIADGDLLVFDINTVGTGAQGLLVYLIGTG